MNLNHALFDIKVTIPRSDTEINQILFFSNSIIEYKFYYMNFQYN